MKLPQITDAYMFRGRQVLPLAFPYSVPNALYLASIGYQLVIVVKMNLQEVMIHYKNGQVCSFQAV